MLRYYYGPGFGFGGVILSFLGIALWILLFWGLFRLLFGHRHHGHYDWHHHDHDHDQGPTDPLEIAKARYAKGEITKTEFEQIKKDLV